VNVKQKKINFLKSLNTFISPKTNGFTVPSLSKLTNTDTNHLKIDNMDFLNQSRKRNTLKYQFRIQLKIKLYPISKPSSHSSYYYSSLQHISLSFLLSLLNTPNQLQISIPFFNLLSHQCNI